MELSAAGLVERLGREGPLHIVRGGSYAHEAAACRCAGRYFGSRTTSSPMWGFRLARDVQPDDLRITPQPIDVASALQTGRLWPLSPTAEQSSGPTEGHSRARTVRDWTSWKPLDGSRCFRTCRLTGEREEQEHEFGGWTLRECGPGQLFNRQGWHCLAHLGPRSRTRALWRDRQCHCPSSSNPHDREPVWRNGHVRKASQGVFK